MTAPLAAPRNDESADPLVVRLTERLRRRGVPVSVAEVVDAHRALAVVGFGDRGRALSSLRTTLVKHGAHDAVFDEVVQQLLAELASVLPPDDPHGGGESTAIFDGSATAAPSLPDEAERRRLLDDTDGDTDDSSRSARRTDGPETGEATGVDGVDLDVVAALASADRRWHRIHTSMASRPQDVMPTAMRLEIDRAARAFVSRHRRDARRWGPARTGRLDVRATLRTTRSTGGVPMDLRRRARVRRAPKVLVLADVSVSVRPTARLALHTADALTRRSRGVRLHVFVDRAVDATVVVRQLPPDVAVTTLLDGGLVDVGASSDYGAALRAARGLSGSWMRRGATVIVFGDGRSNGADPGFEVIEEWAKRAREIHWCTPEPTAAWSSGFGEMRGYADRITSAHHVRTVDDVVAALGRAPRRRSGERAGADMGRHQ